VADKEECLYYRGLSGEVAAAGFDGGAEVFDLFSEELVQIR